MTNQTHTSARQPKKRSPMLVGGATIISFVALLYIVEAFDQLNGHRFDDNGIRPLETDGLSRLALEADLRGLLHAGLVKLAQGTGLAGGEGTGVSEIAVLGQRPRAEQGRGLIAGGRGDLLLLAAQPGEQVPAR